MKNNIYIYIIYKRLLYCTNLDKHKNNMKNNFYLFLDVIFPLFFL